YKVTQTELSSDTSLLHRQRLPTNSKWLEKLVCLALHSNISLICVVHPKGAPHTLIPKVDYFSQFILFYLFYPEGNILPEFKLLD
ncbi:MAG: hypothetical protein ACI4DW_01965, partial [Lachnospiraceae bacterium]